jgi:hypothetical protein
MFETLLMNSLERGKTRRVMSKDRLPPLDNSHIQEFDVLCGRGKDAYNHGTIGRTTLSPKLNGDMNEYYQLFFDTNTNEYPLFHSLYTACNSWK